MTSSFLLAADEQHTGTSLTIFMLLFVDIIVMFRAARHGLKLSGKLKRLAKQEHKSSSIKNGKLLVVECKAKKHCQRIDGVAQKECSPSLDVDVYQSVGSNDGVCVCKHKKPKRRFQRVSVVLQKECSL